MAAYGTTEPGLKRVSKICRVIVRYLLIEIALPPDESDVAKFRLLFAF